MHPQTVTNTFFKSLLDIIAVETEGTLICGGDLNVIRDHNLDTTNAKRSKTHLTRNLNILLEEMGMIDVWRDQHPSEKDFTHYSAAHRSHSRIDYFFYKCRG